MNFAFCIEFAYWGLNCTVRGLIWIRPKCTFEDLYKAFNLSVRCRVIRCWSDMPNSVLNAKFAEFSWSEWGSIVRYDLLKIAKHYEDFSEFSHSIESVCAWNLFCTSLFTIRVDPHQPHRTIEGSCIVDVNSLPWTWGKIPYWKWRLGRIFWMLRARNTLRTETFNIRIDTMPPYAWACQVFIRTTPMWVSWRRLSIVNLSVWGRTTLKPQSRILSSIVSSSLRR